MMEYRDLNIWGLLAMPVGLFLCFGTPMVIWLIGEMKGKSSSQEKKSR